MDKTNCIFYKKKTYDFWSEAKSSFWVRTCIALCGIYILCGVPMLIYLSKDENSKKKRRNSFEMDVIKTYKVGEISSVLVPTTSAIPKVEFAALFRVGLIPKKNEYGELNDIDTQNHVLKYSTGYGNIAKHSALNR